MTSRCRLEYILFKKCNKHTHNTLTLQLLIGVPKILRLEAIQRGRYSCISKCMIHHDFSIILDNIYGTKMRKLEAAKLLALRLQSWVGNETSVKKDTTLSVSPKFRISLLPSTIMVQWKMDVVVIIFHGTLIYGRKGSPTPLSTRNKALKRVYARNVCWLNDFWNVSENDWMMASKNNIFTPILGEMIQFDEHSFSMDWFNSQLGGLVAYE